MTGVRFGFLIGLFFTIPMSYNWYVILPIPYHLALRWFLFGMGEIIIAGIIVALLYKPLATTDAQSTKRGGQRCKAETST